MCVRARTEEGELQSESIRAVGALPAGVSERGGGVWAVAAMPITAMTCVVVRRKGASTDIRRREILSIRFIEEWAAERPTRPAPAMPYIPLPCSALHANSEKDTKRKRGEEGRERARGCGPVGVLLSLLLSFVRFRTSSEEGREGRGESADLSRRRSPKGARRRRRRLPGPVYGIPSISRARIGTRFPPSVLCASLN